MADISLITELDRLHHRATDMRARERQLADAGENDPASDAWKTASILAASAESEFEIALVEAWPALVALLREAGGWRPIESAPRDGTSILAVVAGCHPKTGVPFIAEVIEWTEWGWWNEMWGDETDNVGHYNPTHWRPLPPAPEKSHD